MKFVPYWGPSVYFGKPQNYFHVALLIKQTFAIKDCRKSFYSDSGCLIFSVFVLSLLVAAETDSENIQRILREDISEQLH